MQETKTQFEEEVESLIGVVEWCQQKKIGKDHLLIKKEIESCSKSSQLNKYWRLTDKWLGL